MVSVLVAVAVVLLHVAHAGAVCCGGSSHPQFFPVPGSQCISRAGAVKHVVKGYYAVGGAPCQCPGTFDVQTGQFCPPAQYEPNSPSIVPNFDIEVAALESDCAGGTFDKPTQFMFCSADLSADPLMSGFDGSTYSLQGFGAGVFNLVSETAHQINVKLEPFGLADTKVIRGLGIKVGSGAEIELGAAYDDAAHAAGGMFVRLNGEDVPADSKPQLLPAGSVDGADLKFSAASEYYEFVLRSSTLELVARKPAGSTNIDLELTVFKDVPVHGVLGQTLKWREGDGDASFEGDEADYAVSHLFADDFKYNLYNVRPHGTQRRLLMIEEPEDIVAKAKVALV